MMVMINMIILIIIIHKGPSPSRHKAVIMITVMQMLVRMMMIQDTHDDDDDDDDDDIHCAGLVWRQVRTCFLRQRRWFASDVGKVERWVGGLRLMTLRVDFPVGPSHDKSTQLDTIKKCGQRKDVYALQKDVFSEYLALLHSLKISMFLY